MGVGEKIKDAFRHPEDKKATNDGGETGREGVPGTVTNGDPSMGGKFNSSEPSQGRPSNTQDTPGIVQTGDPSMGGKHTRAEGINQ